MYDLETINRLNQEAANKYNNEKKQVYQRIDLIQATPSARGWAKAVLFLLFKEGRIVPGRRCEG